MRQGTRLGGTIFVLFVILALPSLVLAQVVPVVEWELGDGTVVSASSGPLGATGVTVEVRPTALAHGTRYDVRLRNRTGTDFTHVALRVHLPREGVDTSAGIEGLTVALPAEIDQWWEPGSLAGAKYGFACEIRENGTFLQFVGPSATEGQWGGRARGIVRIDGKAYFIPEFWERQPRKMTVTSEEVLLTLFEGSESFRAGEDIWDRFAIISDSTLSDDVIVSETEGLPDLTLSRRQELMQRFGLAPEGLQGQDPETETWLRKYDQWQGTSWEKKYADDFSGRWWPGEEDSTKTTLFSLFERGFYYAVEDAGIYRWRDYGDIQWNAGMSDLHYDWLRAGFKHYLRTGNQNALRWAMAAMRHAVSVDHVWESEATPARYDYLNLAGLTRYEKGDHGGTDFVARPTHTWAEGLFIAAAITGDPWVQEAAADVAEGAWRYWGGPDPAVADDCGETRVISWPLLVQVMAFRETGDTKYWEKAKELMAQILAQEIASGGGGYVTHRCGWGNQNNAQPLMNAYSTRGMVAFAEEAQRRGEWTEAYTSLMRRWAIWLTTPVPNGAYFPDGTYFNPPNPDIGYGTYVYFFCPPGLTCVQPTSTTGEPVYNMMVADLFTWLAQNDPSGGNPNTERTWQEMARMTFRDGVHHNPQPNGTVGYLTDMYPTTETKALGWMQLFSDRTARWLAGVTPVVTCEGENGKNYPIGDLATIRSPIPLACSTGAITEVRVNVDLLHKRMSDLKVWVVHPDGTKVRIWNREGGKQQNLHQAFTISAFNGKAPVGKWKLWVYDVRTGATGKIDYWKIEVDSVP